jgi:hypothetical protein
VEASYTTDVTITGFYLFAKYMALNSGYSVPFKVYGLYTFQLRQNQHKKCNLNLRVRQASASGLAWQGQHKVIYQDRYKETRRVTSGGAVY